MFKIRDDDEENLIKLESQVSVKLKEFMGQPSIIEALNNLDFSNQNIDKIIET